MNPEAAPISITMQKKPFAGAAARWLSKQRLSPAFWRFFGIAFFFDAGFAVYFFLFNLFLVDAGFHEQAIGFIQSAFTLGSVAGTLPAGAIARRAGVRPLLTVCLIAAPLLGLARILTLPLAVHIVLAFVFGMAMCLWGICFLPAVTRLTDETNRGTAFSLIFSVSIGTSSLGSLLSGYFPQWIRHAGLPLTPLQSKQVLLAASCGIAALALFAVRGLRLPEEESAGKSSLVGYRRLLAGRQLRTLFLLIVAWSAILAAFTPFGSIYLKQVLHLSFSQVGVIFSISQILQLCAGMATAALYRSLGLTRSIALTQIGAALMLLAMSPLRSSFSAVPLYLGFMAAQWMCSPALYNLLMSSTPDADRSTMASVILCSNALAGAGISALAGTALMHFGYAKTFALLGILALMVGMRMAFLRLPGQQGLSQDCHFPGDL